MIVLGIDPGTTRLGYALIGGTPQKPALLKSGVIGNAKLGRSGRLKEIYTELTGLILKEKPDILAVEKLFFSKNVRTALAVAEARGIILLTAEMAGLKVYEYAPQEIKIALTSSGSAGKVQVARMVKALLGIRHFPRWDDESDAMAIALTALVSAGRYYEK